MTDEHTLDEQASDLNTDNETAATDSVDAAQQRIAELEDQLHSAQVCSRKVCYRLASSGG